MVSPQIKIHINRFKNYSIFEINNLDDFQSLIKIFFYEHEDIEDFEIEFENVDPISIEKSNLTLINNMKSYIDLVTKMKKLRKIFEKFELCYILDIDNKIVIDETLESMFSISKNLKKLKIDEKYLEIEKIIKKENLIPKEALKYIKKETKISKDSKNAEVTLEMIKGIILMFSCVSRLLYSNTPEKTNKNKEVVSVAPYVYFSIQNEKGKFNFFIDDLIDLDKCMKTMLSMLYGKNKAVIYNSKTNLDFVIKESLFDIIGACAVNLNRFKSNLDKMTISIKENKEDKSPFITFDEKFFKNLGYKNVFKERYGTNYKKIKEIFKSGEFICTSNSNQKMHEEEEELKMALISGARVIVVVYASVTKILYSDTYYPPEE